jgi:hypothetical protein
VSAPPARWPWALVLVTSVHLLTTSGTWAILDHGEILYTARHLLHHGTLDLTAPGVPRLPFMPTVAARPGAPVRSRFLPLPTLTLVPLLALDEALGWGDPREFGHLVHLQGHLMVTAGLALLGLAIRRTGGSDAAAAMAVLLAGLAWPVWLVSRRVGPEPVMVLLVSLFVLADSFPGWRSRALVKGLVCALFPWTHVTGALVSAALAASAAATAILARTRRDAQDRPWAEAATVTALATVGAASMIYFWNHRFHGNWVAGGYGLYAPEQAFGARNAAVGVLQYLVAFTLECPVLVGLAAAGVRVAGRRPPVDAYLAAAAGVTAVILLVFATFFAPDPTRRLAVACPLWAAVAAAAWDRLGLRAPWPQALVAASGLVSFARFAAVDGGWRVSAGGWNLPQYVLWADLVRAGRPWWMVAGPVALLLAVVLVSTARIWALLREGPARLDRPAAAL